MTGGTVYVGIVTYNSAADLPRCMAALRMQTWQRLSVHVLDNHSSDDSVSWLRQHAPEARVIESRENLGFGRGHNAILRTLQLSDEDFYLPLNPDARPDAGYIEGLVNASRQHDAGWCIGKLLLADEDGEPVGILYSAGHGLLRNGHVINVGQGLADDGRFDEAREIMLASGAAMLLRADLIRDLALAGDLFEPAFFMYGEDIDLGWRARRAGWRCWYQPSVTALHRGGSQSPQTRAQAQGNLYLSALKNAFWLDLLFLILPLMFVSLLARLALAPRQGWTTIRLVLRHGVMMLRKRVPPRVTRQYMLSWHTWSASQATAQPRSLSARLRRFLSQRRTSRRL